MKRLLMLVSLTVAVIFGPCWLWAQTPARNAGYLYLSPVPGAPFVATQNRYILVRFSAITPTQVTNLTTDFITVNGSNSGPHSGVTSVASDGRTVMFIMGRDFTSSELVTVTLNPQVGPGAVGAVAPYQYQFAVTTPVNALVASSAKAPTRPLMPAGQDKISSRTGVAASTKRGAIPKAMLLTNGVSVPGDFPQVVITVNNNPSPGYLFLENGLLDVPPYTMIMDNNGLPVWYSRGRMYDFKIQKNGMITWCLSDDAGFPAFDQNFNYLKTYTTTNGYLTDGHELKVMADGTYFMIGYQNCIVGSLGSTIRETALQEFTAAGDLILQWRAWDNYNIADVNGNPDFPHLNGIDIDDDGNILVSARHLSEVTKINHDSGDIMWRLSGAHSSFSFINDPFNGTSFQHNISALGNGHYMVFDNGDYHTPQVSRAVEYQLDLTNMTATVAWQFRDTPDKYAYYLGSSQRLPTGNTLIDFVLGAYPKAIEVDTNGIKHFELSMIPGADSYRAFRLPWNGVVAAPYLILEPQVDNLTLIFNKFGDHNVAYFRIYGGLAPHPTNLLAASTTTLKQLSNLQNGFYFFRVTAVSSDGVESPFSNEEGVNVNITPPGQNMVANGDFSQGYIGWALTVSGNAAAHWTLADAISDISITNGGTTLFDVQFVQSSLALIQGKQYVLQFDAWSGQPRYIGVALAQTNSPFVDYSRITPPFLTPNPTHYRFVFTMQQASDFSANLSFNLGASTGDVYLDHISLFESPTGDMNLDGRVDLLDLSVFSANWLKNQTGLPADLNGDGKVDFIDLSILGQNWTPGLP
jgi:hypothetical protein